MSHKHPYTNRLINEKSPYLQQHAHNPVDWYPWGEEAFYAAKELDRPIFLSIGYATCHWCHVMEKESFENWDIAKLLNDNFINIKVDREELPEIDLLYMEFAQSMMSGAAGWPLNVILTPDLQPFFAATYLPATQSHGLMGLQDLIIRLREIWLGDEREKIIHQAEKIVQVFSESVHTTGKMLPAKEMIEATKELLIKLSDPVYGGMKGAPKFPIGYQCNFLLREAKCTSDSRALFLVERTLDMMHRGGIYDHIGGGFSRYSVDEEWFVPHFEKMLYDNALLIHSYLEAWQATKKVEFSEVCQEIITYIINEMTHVDGGFYSAEDADSEGVEGLYYTFTHDEVINKLGQEDGKLFCEFYNIIPQGNFEGRNILHTPLTLEEFASENGLDPVELKETLLRAKQKIKNERDKRTHPFKDDKILSSWNGLMIYSMAEAGAALKNQQYLHLAKKSASFIKKTMTTPEKFLLRRWCDGEALFKAGLDEYAFLIRGLISLFETGCGSEWLQWALELSHSVDVKFKAVDGAYYQTDGEDIHIILRKCQYSDGAEPSGNAIHAENLLRLYQLTGNRQFLTAAEDVFKAVQRYLDSYSPGYIYHMISLLRYYDKKAPTIVIALNEKEEYRQELMDDIYTNFIAHKAVVVRKGSDTLLFNILPYVKEQIPINGETTLYICFEGVCEKPTQGLDNMKKAIQKLS